MAGAALQAWFSFAQSLFVLLRSIAILIMEAAFVRPTFRSVTLQHVEECRQTRSVQAASAAGAKSLRWQVHGATDIGGARENQDEYFILDFSHSGAIVIGVLDGHGRDVGKTAAAAARERLESFMQAHIGELLNDPYECMVRAFVEAHAAVQEAFERQLESAGYEVQVTDEGYMVKRRRDGQPWMCVHGGTSCSVIAIVGQTMIIANVGDSTGLICAPHKELNEGLLRVIGDAGFDENLVRRETRLPRRAADRYQGLSNGHGNGHGNGFHPASDTSGHGHDGTNDDDDEFFDADTGETKMQMEPPAPLEPLMFDRSTGPLSEPAEGSPRLQCDDHPNAGPCVGNFISANKQVMLLTGDHSPENPHEFDRLRRFWPQDLDPTQPKLLVVYDAPTHDKTCCNAVFELHDNRPVATSRGKYYKNVRREWASLVATPMTAKFQDALAFTRSIGDFHLHTYGVTHLPEIRQFDLSSLLQGSDDPSQVPLVSIMLSTDGVWDNWTYEDVSTFVLDHTCTAAVLEDSNGARRVLQSFMHRNAAFARRNFGNQADNATGILLYISNDPRFPV